MAREKEEGTISRKILLHFSARQIRPTWLARVGCPEHKTEHVSGGVPGVGDKAQSDVSACKLGVLTLLCHSVQATSPLSLCVLRLLITMPSVTAGIRYQ